MPIAACSGNVQKISGQACPFYQRDDMEFRTVGKAILLHLSHEPIGVSCGRDCLYHCLCRCPFLLQNIFRSEAPLLVALIVLFQSQPLMIYTCAHHGHSNFCVCFAGLCVLPLSLPALRFQHQLTIVLQIIFSINQNPMTRRKVLQHR